jgi:hypothetical protein
MNPEIFKYSSACGHTRRLATLFLLLCASLPMARAKDRKPHTSAAVKVIASMSFDNKPAADMLIQQVNGKPYLFVQLANAQGVVVVDISKPNKLKIASSLSGPDATGANQFSINGNAAMMTAVAGDPSTTSAGKGELVVWDISEPSNPRVVQRFSGVVRVLRDERNYTYVLNQDGLWVVYDKQNQPAPEDNNWLLGIYG